MDWRLSVEEVQSETHENSNNNLLVLGRHYDSVISFGWLKINT